MPTKNIISNTVKHLPTITKIMLMLATAAIIPLLFPSEGKGLHYDYAEGGIWRMGDLVAPHDFAVARPQAEVDQEVAEARENLLLYYHYDNTAYNRTLERLNSLSTTYPDSRIRQMRNAIDSIYRTGYVEMPNDVPDFKRHDMIILEGNVGSQHSVTEYVSPLDVRDSLLRERVLVPSLAFDRNRTQLELDSRLSQMAPRRTNNCQRRTGDTREGTDCALAGAGQRPTLSAALPPRGTLCGAGGAMPICHRGSLPIYAQHPTSHIGGYPQSDVYHGADCRHVGVDGVGAVCECRLGANSAAVCGADYDEGVFRHAGGSVCACCHGDNTRQHGTQPV